MGFNKKEVRNLADVNGPLQDEIRRVIREVEEMLIGAKQPVQVTLTTTDTAVRHGLGRSNVRYIELGKNAGATVFTGAAHSDPTNYINLKASATVTVTLVFL